MTDKVKCPESVTLQGYAALIIDGFALVAAIGKPEKATSFGGFADCYVGAVLRKGSGYQRIDVLLRIRSFSEALHQSNDKNSTRQEKGAACAQSYRKRRGSVADEVALGDDKADLARFRSDDIIAQAPADTAIAVSGGGS